MIWNVQHMEQPKHYSVGKGLVAALSCHNLREVTTLGHSDLLVDKPQDDNIPQKALGEKLLCRS